MRSAGEETGDSRQIFLHTSRTQLLNHQPATCCHWPSKARTWPHDNTGMMHRRLAFLIVALHATLSYAESKPFGVLHRLSNYKNVPAGKPWLLPPRGGSTSAKDFRRNSRASDVGQIITAVANDSDDMSEYSNTFVVKRDGRTELLDKVKVNEQSVNFNQCKHQPHDKYISIVTPFKIKQRLRSLTDNLSPSLSLDTLATSILHGTYPNITTKEIDTLASETAASMSTQHFDYGRLAARICATSNHKSTPSTFSEAMLILNEEGSGFVNNQVADLVRRRGKEIDEKIAHERDLDMTYFGFKTLERSYLLKLNEELIIERPQYLWMRVALGIHCCKSSAENIKSISKEEEDANLQAAFETYDLMSRGYFTHASPTLFHAGTTHPQLSSCFLVQMSDDSINGIYDTLKRCAVISKVSCFSFNAKGEHCLRFSQLNQHVLFKLGCRWDWPVCS
jgi:hypothetical protein